MQLLLGLTKTNHVLDELVPEENQAAFGVMEMTVLGELDDAGFEVVIDLLAHLGLDGFL